MKCFNDEQLARLTLGLSDDSTEANQITAHLDSCEKCSARLARQRQLIGRLTSAHAELEQRHESARARLLAELPNLEFARGSSDDSKPRFIGLSRFTLRQRITAIGIASAAVAAIALIAVAISSSRQLSAMERMCKELQQVKSYSFRNTEHVTVQNKEMKTPGIVDMNDMVYWQAPGSLREDLKIVISGNLPRGYKSGQADCDIVSISLSDKPGILIDHLTKTFLQESKLRAENTGSGSLTYPNYIIRMIREEPGKIVRDLGIKNIQGKQAHGYAMVYKNDTDPMDVWLDPQTDLPLEIDRTLKDETTMSVEKYSDFRWNIDLDPKLFDTTPPVGYTDIAPPDDAASIAAISAALRWYADLSGHYPQADTEKVNEKFDADTIYAEMLKMAGYSGVTQPQWNNDSKYRELQQTKAGLDWIAKITRARGTTRYDGLHVTPKDKDKVLLWWLPGSLNGSAESYRVFYGDLHTKLLTKAEAEKEIPPAPKLWDELPEDGKASADKR